jgi:hypothetical protein
MRAMKKIAVAVVGTLLVLLVVVLVANDPRQPSRSDRLAGLAPPVGECWAGAEIVACDDPRAEYRVLAILIPGAPLDAKPSDVCPPSADAVTWPAPDEASLANVEKGRNYSVCLELMTQRDS